MGPCPDILETFPIRAFEIVRTISFLYVSNLRPSETIQRRPTAAFHQRQPESIAKIGMKWSHGIHPFSPCSPASASATDLMPWAKRIGGPITVLTIGSATTTRTVHQPGLWAHPRCLFSIRPHPILSPSENATGWRDTERVGS